MRTVPPDKRGVESCSSTENGKNVSTPQHFGAGVGRWRWDEGEVRSTLPLMPLRGSPAELPEEAATTGRHDGYGASRQASWGHFVEQVVCAAGTRRLAPFPPRMNRDFGEFSSHATEAARLVARLPAGSRVQTSIQQVCIGRRTRDRVCADLNSTVKNRVRV